MTSLTVIEESLSKKLKLSGPSDDLCIKTTGGITRWEKNSRQVHLKISSQYNPKKLFDVNLVRTVQSLGLPKQTLDATQLQELYPHLKDLPLQSFSGSPEILIGLNNSKLLMTTQNKVDDESDIVASKTCLGWVIYGFQSTTIGKVFHLCECQSAIDQQLHEILKDYFTLENSLVCPVKAMMSEDDIRAQRLLEENTVLKDDHYECSLLWKFDNITLPNSYNMALQRLRCLERKLSKTQQTAARFHEIIHDYKKKGYIRELTETEIRSEKSWYLPVFTVQNSKKPDKLRIVWDAAAKVRNTSLNTVLLKGKSCWASH